MEVKANTCGELPMVRLFVGGIPPGTTCEQLEHRFASFGVVAGCHIVGPKEYKFLAEGGSFYRGLGYVDLEPVDDAALRKCMAAYNGSKWRGHVLRCQVAKPDYVQRLQQEREEDLALQGPSWLWLGLRTVHPLSALPGPTTCGLLADALACRSHPQ